MSSDNTCLCPISLGELVDKLSILMIKQKKIKEDQKQAYIIKEKKYLKSLAFKFLNLQDYSKYLGKLIEINKDLWELEDKIRQLGNLPNHSLEFIRVAKQIYQKNDQRFKVKSQINQLYPTSFKEVKSFL